MLVAGQFSPVLPHGIDVEQLQGYTYPALSSFPLEFAAGPALQAPFAGDRFDTDLATVVHSLQARCSIGTLALVQVWKPTAAAQQCPSPANQPYVVLCAAPPFASNGMLREFRLRSCQQGITGETLGLMEKVWTGAVQVVQNVTAVPCHVHPRNKLSGRSLAAVSELIYIPVYDMRQPHGGVKAILEILVSSRNREAMPVANIISHVSAVMDSVQLSLSSMSFSQPQMRAAPGGEPSLMQEDGEDAPRPPKSMSRCASVRGSVADLLSAELTKSNSA